MARMESQANQGLAVSFLGEHSRSDRGRRSSMRTVGAYWGATNGANGGSAFAYIPKMGWNDSRQGTVRTSGACFDLVGAARRILLPCHTAIGLRLPQQREARRARHLHGGILTDGYLALYHRWNYYEISFGGTLTLIFRRRLVSGAGESVPGGRRARRVTQGWEHLIRRFIRYTRPITMCFTINLCG